MTAARASVPEYYRSKTASILDKYGPGPRVHYHTGLVDPDLAVSNTSRDSLRAGMFAAQERLLEHVCEASPVAIAGHVLDVGCGLGGGSLFWAGNQSVQHVDAITIESTHVACVTHFAAQACLSERVSAALLDAHEVVGPPRYDHVFAIESSCYLDRARWAERVALALNPSGVVHVVDCFSGGGAPPTWFDERWKTRIGGLSEYARAFEAAGLTELEIEDLAPRAAGFWDLSCSWIETSLEGLERAQYDAHRRLQRALRTGEIRYLRVTARRVPKQ